MPFPYLELHQTNMKTIISVCKSSGCYVIPVGWTFWEGPIQLKWANVSTRNKGGLCAKDSRTYSRPRAVSRP